MKYLGDLNPDKHMLINIIYNRKSREASNDYLYIIYKNKETGEKLLKTIKDPEMDYYLVKEECRDFDYHKDFMPLDKVEKRTCKARNIVYDVANVAGGQYKAYLDHCNSTGQWKEKNKLHGIYPYAFGSDIPIETWYKIQYLLEYPSENIVYPMTKQFLDIEVDGIDVEGFPTPDVCPINAVTIIDAESKTSYTFLLRNNKNPLIQEFEDDIEEFKQDLHDSFDESYGVFDYKFLMYDREIDLIIDMFKLINTLKRDFLMIWNMSFDIPYIIERIHALGYEHEPIMCHKDFETQSAYYVQSKTKIVEQRTDRFACNSYTTYLDQMVMYAGLRKGGGVLRSHKLNDVGRKELGDEKLDYSQDANIKTLPYVDYKKFVKYNIKDVLLQYGIDEKTGDLDDFYLRTFYNATPYERAFKQTTFLKNCAYVSFFQQGYIICNNRPLDDNVDENSNIIKTIFDDEPDVKEEEEEKEEQFAGALVADPMLNSPNGIMIFGKNSAFVYDYVTDEDFSAMYPSVIIAFNVTAATLIGKLVLDIPVEKVKQFYEMSDKDIRRFDAGREFIENYISQNPGLVGNIWFNLPTSEDLIAEFGGLQ